MQNNISTDDKFNLVREAVKLCIKQEFRGGILSDFEPKIRIVVDKENRYTGTHIELEGG